MMDLGRDLFVECGFSGNGEVNLNLNFELIGVIVLDSVFC